MCERKLGTSVSQRQVTNLENGSYASALLDGIPMQRFVYKYLQLATGNSAPSSLLRSTNSMRTNARARTLIDHPDRDSARLGST